MERKGENQVHLQGVYTERGEEKCSHEQRILLTAFAYRTVKYRAAHGIYCFAWPSWHRFAASFAPSLFLPMKIHSRNFLSFPFRFLFSLFYSLSPFFPLFFFVLLPSTGVDTVSLSTADDSIERNRGLGKWERKG